MLIQRIFKPCLLLLFLIGSLYAPPNELKELGDKGNEPYTIDADHFESKLLENGERVTYLTGNCRLVHGDLTIRCEKTILYKERNLADLETDVVITQKGMRATAKKGVYQRAINRLYLEGDVHIVDGDNDIKAEKVTYYRTKMQAVAEKHVIMINKKEHTTITGEYALWDRVEQSGFVTENPKMVIVDNGEEYTLYSQKLEVYNKEKKAVAVQDVRMISKDVNATCGVGTFYQKQGRIVMMGEPVLFRDSRKIFGNEIILYVENRDVKEVVVIGNARAEDIVSTRFGNRTNWASGDRIVIDMGSSGVDDVNVIGNAKSEYFYEDEDQNKVDLGRNRIKGDRITIIWDHNVSFEEQPKKKKGEKQEQKSKIKRIVAYGSTEGIFYPAPDPKPKDKKKEEGKKEDKGLGDEFDRMDKEAAKPDSSGSKPDSTNTKDNKKQ